MPGRIREARADTADIILDGTVEVDETYVGGREKNKHASKRLGRNHRSGKAVVVPDPETGKQPPSSSTTQPPRRSRRLQGHR